MTMVQMAKPRKFREQGPSSAAASFDDRLDRIEALDGMKGKASKAGLAHPMECPCCKQAVVMPTVEMVIDLCRVPRLEGAILRAVWKGKGYPVQTERIFDAMYADDPDGGPSTSRMYPALKAAMFRLRSRLEGSGVNVENVGYRRGYRLVIGE